MTNWICLSINSSIILKGTDLSQNYSSMELRIAPRQNSSILNSNQSVKIHTFFSNSIIGQDGNKRKDLKEIDSFYFDKSTSKLSSIYMSEYSITEQQNLLPDRYTKF